MRQTILIPVRATDSWPDKMHEVAKKLREVFSRDYQVRPRVRSSLVVSFEVVKGRVGWWAECRDVTLACVEVVIRSIRLANEHVWAEAYEAFAPELARAARERCRGGRPQWRPDWSAIERAGGCVVGRAEVPEVADHAEVSDKPPKTFRGRDPVLEDPDEGVAQLLAARVVPSVKMARFSLHVGEDDELAARFVTATAARAHADAMLAHRAVSVRMDDDPRPIAWRDAGAAWRPGDDDLLWAVEP